MWTLTHFNSLTITPFLFYLILHSIVPLTDGGNPYSVGGGNGGGGYGLTYGHRNDGYGRQHGYRGEHRPNYGPNNGPHYGGRGGGYGESYSSESNEYESEEYGGGAPHHYGGPPPYPQGPLGPPPMQFWPSPYGQFVPPPPQPMWPPPPNAPTMWPVPPPLSPPVQCFPYPYGCQPPAGQPPGGQPPGGQPPSVTPAPPGQAGSSTAATNGVQPSTVTSPTSTASAGGGGQTAGSGATTVSGNTAVTSTAVSATTASQGALSLAQRTAALNIHNDFRSSLANGTASNQTGTMPTGTNIVQLVYDTSLESTAESWAQQCTFQHSSDSQRNGAGENLYWTSDRTIDFSTVLVDAARFWWNELVQFGIQASLNLTLDEFNKGIGHWSQMAWCSTERIGCGVNVCSNATYVVCHYSPAGNVINQLVYKSGTACADCVADYGNSATCSNSLCVMVQ